MHYLGKGKGKGGRGEKKAVSRSAKAGLQFPVGRIGRFLKQGKYATRMGGESIDCHTVPRTTDHLRNFN
jgi:hypothetical protein